MQPLEIDITTFEDTTRIRVSGNIDEAGAETLKERFFGMDMAAVQQVVIDFAGVAIIGSAGIGKLLLFYKQLNRCGGNLRIENVGAPIYELLRVIKLDTIVPIAKAQKGSDGPAAASSALAANTCSRR